MPSSDSQSSPSSKDSGSLSGKNKKKNKNGSSASSGNKKKPKTSSNISKDDNKNDSKKKNKKNNDDKKSSSLALPRSPSSLLDALSPPRKSSSISRKKSNSSESSDYNTNNVIITGASIGAVLLLVLMIACMVCCCRKKKTRQKKDKNYYTNKDEIKESNDLHLKMPPQPHSGSTSSEQGWRVAPPQPPPPMMSSREMSSVAYSGPYQAPLPPPHPNTVLGLNTNAFTYDELAAATKGFDRSLLLGQGGFGHVHVGTLPNGKDIAVKSLKLGGGQWDCEFEAEFENISRVHHRHLVSVVGYCITGQQRMLVYEFIPNKTLKYHLHGEGLPVMDCATRIRIALGAAKGLAYLHEDCNPSIIHRDIKAANILIDDHFEAKVADFGLAKLSSETITHVSTRIMGTFGYLAPEYASTGKLTDKSDVFSYGVVLLELITGRRPINRDSDEDNLIDWARPILLHSSNGGSFEELVDPRLEESYNRDDIHRMAACAAAAIRHSARIRPKMSQIVRVLEGQVSLDEVNEVGKNMRNTHLVPM